MLSVASPTASKLRGNIGSPISPGSHDSPSRGRGLFVEQKSDPSSPDREDRLHSPFRPQRSPPTRVAHSTRVGGAAVCDPLGGVFRREHHEDEDHAKTFFEKTIPADETPTSVCDPGINLL